MSLNRRFGMERGSIQFNDDEFSVSLNYEIGFNAAVIITPADKDWQRGKCDTAGL